MNMKIINETRTIENGPRPYVFSVYSVYEASRTTSTTRYGRRLGCFQTRKYAETFIQTLKTEENS